MADFNLDEFKKLVFRHLDDSIYRAFIFGSRATGTNRKYSDLDLGIIAKTKVPTSKIFDLENEFDQSNLPYKVDVVDFNNVSENFKKVAMKKVLYLN
ncbi:MAG: hypothetical protein ACD_19C00014G0040 [uncultured bacterium]|nr:MAG: hypothetical protein ACD_19C00014G0040 [uncultured bacterium]